MKRLLAAATVCLAMGSRPAFASEFDVESGLVHMGAREYDPNDGRFLQEDPEFHPRRSSYNYALNNPLKYIDPLGTDVILVQEGIQNFNHEVVYVGDPQNGYTTFQFGPQNQTLGLLLPADVAGHAYAFPMQQTVNGQILAQFPEDYNADQTAISQARAFLNSPQWKNYNLYTNNCQDFSQSLYKKLTISIGPQSP